MSSAAKACGACGAANPAASINATIDFGTHSGELPDDLLRTFGSVPSASLPPPQSEKACPACDAKLELGAKFCWSCGMGVGMPTRPEPRIYPRVEPEPAPWGDPLPEPPRAEPQRVDSWPPPREEARPRSGPRTEPRPAPREEVPPRGEPRADHWPPPREEACEPEPPPAPRPARAEDLWEDVVVTAWPARGEDARRRETAEPPPGPRPAPEPPRAERHAGWADDDEFFDDPPPPMRHAPAGDLDAQLGLKAPSGPRIAPRPGAPRPAAPGPAAPKAPEPPPARHHVVARDDDFEEDEPSGEGAGRWHRDHDDLDALIGQRAPGTAVSGAPRAAAPGEFPGTPPWVAPVAAGFALFALGVALLVHLFAPGAVAGYSPAELDLKVQMRAVEWLLAGILVALVGLLAKR